MGLRLRILHAPPGAGRSEFILRELLARLRSGEVSAESALVLTPTGADTRLLSARFDRLALDTDAWFPITFETTQNVAREILAKEPRFAYHRPMDDM